MLNTDGIKLATELDHLLTPLVPVPWEGVGVVESSFGFSFTSISTFTSPGTGLIHFSKNLRIGKSCAIV
jgi:hypothetical protein